LQDIDPNFVFWNDRQTRTLGRAHTGAPLEVASTTERVRN
jgi:hypothetical protein